MMAIYRDISKSVNSYTWSRSSWAYITFLKRWATHSGKCCSAVVWCNVVQTQFERYVVKSNVLEITQKDSFFPKDYDRACVSEDCVVYPHVKWWREDWGLDDRNTGKKLHNGTVIVGHITLAFKSKMPVWKRRNHLDHIPFPLLCEWWIRRR